MELRPLRATSFRLSSLSLPSGWMQRAKEARAKWAARKSAPSELIEVEPEETLYDVLGVDSDALNWEIQVAYRRSASQFAKRRADPERLKEINAAYEVLGYPERRVEYDRLMVSYADGSIVEVEPEPVQWASAQYPRMRHAHRSRLERASGPSDLIALAAVVIVSLVVAQQVLSRVEVQIPGLDTFGSLVGLTRATRPADGAVLPEPIAVRSSAATAESDAAAEPTAVPSVENQFQASTITVSNATPAQNSTVNVVVSLRRNGEPVADAPVYATVQYRTVQERWPASGTVATDEDGNATISFNIGNATPGHAVDVVAHAQVEGQDLTWPTSFTPR